MDGSRRPNGPRAPLDSQRTSPGLPSDFPRTSPGLRDDYPRTSLGLPWVLTCAQDGWWPSRCPGGWSSQRRDEGGWSSRYASNAEPRISSQRSGSAGHLPRSTWISRGGAPTVWDEFALVSILRAPGAEPRMVSQSSDSAGHLPRSTIPTDSKRFQANPSDSKRCAAIPSDS